MTNEELLFFKQITEKLVKIIENEQKIINNGKPCIDSAKKGADNMKYKGKTISKRPDGRWWARYTKNGKQVSVYGKTQQQVLEKLKEALGTETTKSTKYTLSKWIDKWLELYKIGNVKESTLYAMKNRLKCYVYNSKLANKGIKDITALDLQELLNNITAERQREHVYTHLRDIFNKAHETEVIKKNPMKFVKIKKHKPKETKAYTREEERIFIQHAKKYGIYGDFYLLMLFEGIRNGELRALRIEDVDFENKTITINKTYDDLGNVTSPKTEDSNRTIPLFNRAYDILIKYKDTPGQVFNYSKCMYQKNFKKLMQSIGWEDKGFTINSGRHTFITRLRENRVDEKLIELWVGHSENSQVSKRHYMHVNPDFEQKIIAEINEE